MNSTRCSTKILYSIAELSLSNLCYFNYYTRRLVLPQRLGDLNPWNWGIVMWPVMNCHIEVEKKFPISCLGCKEDDMTEAPCFPLCVCPKDPVDPTLASAFVSLTFP